MTEQRSSLDLKQETIDGVFWSYLSFFGGKVLTFLSTIILARLLLPEDFGMVGYCLIAIQYLDILNSAGINTSLIAQRERLEEATNAAFMGNIMLGIASFGLTWVLAPSIAEFFKTEEIIPILRLLGLSLPLSGLGMVPDTLLQRHLRFRTRLVPEIGKNLTKGVVSVALAWLGMGVWSLVWGQLAGILVGTVSAWMLAGWTPTWRFHRETSLRVTTYGLSIVALEFIGAFRSNVDYLLVGRVLGAAALGYYTMAYRIPELLIRSLNTVVVRVSLPAMAIAQMEREQMRSFYFSYIRYISLFVFPVSVGMAITAPIFVPLFFSTKWNAAITPTTLISLAMGIAAMSFIPGVLYKAIGKPEMLIKLNFIKVPLTVIILWYATRWGINGVAAGQVVISIIALSIDMLTVNYVMRYSIKDLFQALAPTSVSALVMGIGLWALLRITLFSGLLELILMILTGALVYFAMLWWVKREVIQSGLNIFRRKLMKSRQLVPAEVASDD
jgi:O-antigen/teichoic acid export membrane protein